ncbi:MAG: class II aldolase/adducin family protein [Campylobacterales bacterium]|nr:class II aldolase/adducin family protein [Campylobacterales bacterium]
MQSRFDETEAKKHTTDLEMRVYTSRLLGQDMDLVLHGGGNTSLKTGGYLYVKGSGWNLDTIEEAGFPAVDLKVLQEMAGLEHLSDTEMVARQREALKDKRSPNPSIEAILHAIIPFTFVDHTHADAVVTISNTPEGKRRLQELYGPQMLLIDYVMPGFVLAKAIYEQTKGIDWSSLEGIILLNHGVFTFDDDAKKSYEKMIALVSKAEEYLKQNSKQVLSFSKSFCLLDESFTEELKREVEKLRGSEIVMRFGSSVEASTFSKLDNLDTIFKNGPLTPEHVIRTKPFPAIIEENIKEGLDAFVERYKNYFKAHAKEEIMLDPAPRYAIIKGVGFVTFGKDEKETDIIFDIVSHTIHAMTLAQNLGGWKSLSPKDIFDMEYWELEQAKLRKK